MLNNSAERNILCVSTLKPETDNTGVGRTDQIYILLLKSVLFTLSLFNLHPDVIVILEVKGIFYEIKQ